MRVGFANDSRQLVVSGILFGVLGYGLISCANDKIVDDGIRGTPVVIQAPGFPPMPIPDENPLTEEGIALGRMVFYDPILSGDSTLACAGCHNQDFAFSDNGRSFSTGIQGIEGGRNAPPLINLA